MLANFIEGITSETQVSLGFLGTAVTAAIAIQAFLLNGIKKGAKDTREKVEALGKEIVELKTAVNIRMLAIENRVEGGISVREFQRCMMRLQEDNPTLKIIPSTLSVGETAG